jgi:hypothetical protein
VSETIVTQELAIRVALPLAVPVTGSIPAENTLLIKDASTTVPTYEKCTLDGTLIISKVSGIKKLAWSGIIPGTNNTLSIFSDDSGATVWIWKTADGGETWSKQSQLY